MSESASNSRKRLLGPIERSSEVLFGLIMVLTFTGSLSWPQITYQPLPWLRLGGAAQHTKVFQTSVDVQRGFLVGFSHKAVEFTTYVFDPGGSDASVVLEVGVSF
jgi:hypothetical protein